MAGRVDIWPNLYQCNASICFAASGSRMGGMCTFCESRVDQEMEQYTGALCGLGFDQESKDPIHPDHDIELMFDAQIDESDIDQVFSLFSPTPSPFPPFTILTSAGWCS